MRWESPRATEFRFGMEITMYIKGPTSLQRRASSHIAASTPYAHGYVAEKGIFFVNLQDLALHSDGERQATRLPCERAGPLPTSHCERVRPRFGDRATPRDRVRGLRPQSLKVTRTPCADRLNFRPTSVEMSLITTPCSLLRYTAVPPPATVMPAPAAA
jgi:coenzyme PQQ precursor peptide PqqA